MANSALPMNFQVMSSPSLAPGEHSLTANAAHDFSVNSEFYRPMQPRENEIINNATLRYDEWKDYDKTVIRVARERLRAVNDLMRLGLVYRPANGLASTILQWEDVSDITEATLSMDGINRGTNDRLNYELRYLPLPITHKDWELNHRHLVQSRVNGGGADTQMAALATRRVADYTEDLLINGSGGYSYGGGTIYGYTTAPFRTTDTISGDDNGGAVQWTGWPALIDTAAGQRRIVLDVISWKQQMINNNQFGPYVLYIPTEYETVLDNDYDSGSGVSMTIRERILDIGNVSRIEVLDRLNAVDASGNQSPSGTADTADRVIMVSLNVETVRMVEAMPLTNMMWDAHGKWMHIYKVATILVPNLRTDQEGQSGVLVATESVV